MNARVTLGLSGLCLLAAVGGGLLPSMNMAQQSVPPQPIISFAFRQVDSFLAARNGSHVGVARLATRGFHAAHRGIGAAEYIRSGTAGSPRTGHPGAFFDAGGDGWLLHAPVIHTTQFGAVGTDNVNDSAEINAAYDRIKKERGLT